MEKRLSSYLLRWRTLLLPYPDTSSDMHHICEESVDAVERHPRTVAAQLNHVAFLNGNVRLFTALEALEIGRQVHLLPLSTGANYFHGIGIRCVHGTARSCYSA